MEEARKLAQAEGVALNRLINVAVAEKVSALRTESYFAERARRASVPKALKILKHAGAGKPPMKGDEVRQRRKRAARTGRRTTSRAAEG
ncbi:MAG TPA: toxin-antitoxin system HicB family antitoxin [Xanthobacteraceae bacterium]|nr:toxin-antitoxin system HicB family antitoxin [Xanthobacteraceae bacterium]